MRTLTLLSFAAVAALASSSTATAQELSSDRPGFSSSTSTASTAGPTLEMGILTEQNRPQSWPDYYWTVDNYVFLDLRIRLGLLSWLEVALDTPTLLLQTTDVDTVEVAATNPALALKAGGQLGPHFSGSMRTHFVVPLDGKDAEALFELNFSAEFGVFGFGGNLYVANVPGVEGTDHCLYGDDEMCDRALESAGSLAITIELPSSLGMFVQSYLTHVTDTDAEVYVGTGIYGRVTPRMQLDLEANFGVVDAAARAIATVGMTTLIDVAGRRQGATPAP